jgi:hypothetical protein
MNLLVTTIFIVLNNMLKLRLRVKKMASLIENEQNLPVFTNAPTFAADDVCKPIDTSFIDKMGQSSRSEDIALARSQGLDADDNNEPAPENIPAEGVVVDSTANIHGQEWGWNGTCH